MHPVEVLGLWVSKARRLLNRSAKCCATPSPRLPIAEAKLFAERPKDFPRIAHRKPRELRARFLLTSETCSIGRYRLHRENRSGTTPSCSPGKWIRKGSSPRLRPSMRTWLRANHSGPRWKNSFRARSPML